MLESILLAVAALLIASVLATKATGVLGVPTLLAFIGVGMLAGSDGIGGIWFNDPRFAQNLGVVALAFILFSGGMDTPWPKVRHELPRALSLATVGVMVSALVVGLVAHYFFSFGLLEGLLLGSVVASTDAAAIFSLLRGKSVHLRKDIAAILELESGSNDPMAVFLTIGLVGLLGENPAAPSLLILKFLIQMTVGGLFGYVIGKLAVAVMRSVRLEFEAMYGVLSIAVVLLAYSGAAHFWGNGFLAVYVAGITYGQGRFGQRPEMRRFHDGVAWLMEICMFLVLGLLVFPSRLPGIAMEGIVVALTLMFLARPLAVLASLGPFRTDLRVQGVIAWAGLRGAVPIILATYPLLAGLPRAQEIFDIVFFVVLFSSLLQGTTAPWLANRLGLRESAPA